MNRTMNVVRMQLVNRYTYVWVPLLVLFGAFALTLAVYAIVRNAGADVELYGGGAQAPLWYFGVVGMQALTLTFPFSQAMSVTRREFALGTFVTAALTALALAVIFVIGGLLETATNGWGMRGYFFQLPWMWEAGPVGAGFVFFVVAMLFFVFGFWGATICKRWGAFVVTVVLLGVATLFVLAIGAIIGSGNGPAVWEGIVGLGAVGLAACGLGVLVLLIGSSFATLRRAVP